MCDFNVTEKKNMGKQEILVTFGRKNKKCRGSPPGNLGHNDKMRKAHVTSHSGSEPGGAVLSPDLVGLYSKLSGFGRVVQPVSGTG